jgi:hypothetical protein
MGRRDAGSESPLPLPLAPLPVGAKTMPSAELVALVDSTESQTRPYIFDSI